MLQYNLNNKYKKVNAKQKNHIEKEVTITIAAAAHIAKCIAKRKFGIGIKVSMKKQGCSGIAYVLSYVDQAEITDIIIKITSNSSLALFIDPKTYQYLKGTTFDYVKKGLNSGLDIKNPNEKGRCGCGESVMF